MGTLRKPSNAAIIAKKKSKMAIANAKIVQNGRGSRMLTRLNDREVASVKKSSKKRSKKIAPGTRSLRGRDISLSSNDSSSDRDNKKDEHVKSGRKSNMKNELKNESEAEADADEETSSRESSRRPKSRRSREEGERRDVKEKTFGKESPVARLKKREGRSTSCDSSGSKESLPAGARRSRKTKEAAKNYLNMLGQELAASSKQDEDAISIESFISAAQEKRLGEFEKDEKSAGVKESDSVEVVAPKTIKI